MHATQLHLSICFRYILDFNLVRFFFLVTGTSREIFLCCEANGRDIDKYQCWKIHQIQGHAIGCMSNKHVSVFSAAEQQSNCEDIKSMTWLGIDVNGQVLGVEDI